MKYLELTYPEAAHNLACDEALLEIFEQSRGGEELLRLWQADQFFVVLGHGNKWREEVDASACAANGIPVLRRCSGGGQSPGSSSRQCLFHTGRQSGSGRVPARLLQRAPTSVARLPCSGERRDPRSGGCRPRIRRPADPWRRHCATRPAAFREGEGAGLARVPVASR